MTTLDLNLDTQYSDLIAQMAILNQKLSLFVNGDAQTVIPTDAGAIKSLAGVVSSLNKFKYVQKVVDHRLYSDMVGDDLNLEVGILIRVWGDTGTVNGLYLKTATATFVKSSYNDLYDLRDFLPNPWNIIYIKKDKTQFTGDLPFIQYTIPKTETTVFSRRFSISIKVDSDTAGYRGSVYGEQTILSCVGPGGYQSTSVNQPDLEGVAIDDGFNSASNIQVVVTCVQTPTDNIFTVTLPAMKDTNNVPIPAYLELKILGIDPKQYTVLA